MGTWTQIHPTQRLTASNGESIDIDEEMIPLITQIWRLGYTTLLCCQDAGEAILGGGTRTPEDQRETAAARNHGRAWLIVPAEESPQLLAALRPLPDFGDWTARPAAKDGPPWWTSITFPRSNINDAAELLRMI